MLYYKIPLKNIVNVMSHGIQDTNQHTGKENKGLLLKFGIKFTTVIGKKAWGEEGGM